MRHETGCKPVYFDAQKMGEPEDNYVCWIDVMGTHNQMMRSLPTSANFIYKLHCAVLEAYEALRLERDVGLYPVMDGLYVTSARRQPLSTLLGISMRHVAETFLQESTNQHCFLVRGAIAFGPVYHGRTVHKEANWVLANHVQQRDSILLGLPMAQAYAAESEAPPFGISIDASARAFAPSGDIPFRFIWWDWFSSVSPTLDRSAMLKKLDQYFAWQRQHTHTTGYKLDRIEYHSELAHEYFG